MMYTYKPISAISSPILVFTTPEATVTLSKTPTEISDIQLEYLLQNYPEFVACLNQKIIETETIPTETIPHASSPKRR